MAKGENEVEEEDGWDELFFLPALFGWIPREKLSRREEELQTNGRRERLGGWRAGHVLFDYLPATSSASSLSPFVPRSVRSFTRLINKIKCWKKKEEEEGENFRNRL